MCSHPKVNYIKLLSKKRVEVEIIAIQMTLYDKNNEVFAGSKEKDKFSPVLIHPIRLFLKYLLTSLSLIDQLVSIHRHSRSL